MDGLITRAWQGPLVAAGAAALAHVTARVDATVRDRLRWSALVAVAVLGISAWPGAGAAPSITVHETGTISSGAPVATEGRTIGSSATEVGLIDGWTAEVPEPRDPDWSRACDGEAAGRLHLAGGEQPPPSGGAWAFVIRASGRIDIDTRRAAQATAGVFTAVATSVAGACRPPDWSLTCVFT